MRSRLRSSRLATAATAVLAAALPAGFRDRQRGEWTSDLDELGPGARLSYLLGALRTLPGLRRSVLRHSGAGSGLPAVRLTGAGIGARILLYGLLGPVLSWILMVPVRYYALDVPSRIAGGTADYDPKSLWPLAGTPGWTMPIWVALYLAAWVAVLGVLFLLPWVVMTGSLSVLRRGRARRGLLAAVAVTAAVALVGAMWSLSTGALPFDLAGVNGIRTTGVLGLVAVLCAVRVRDLTRRARTGLAVVGTAAAGMAVWTATPAGQAVLWWFMD
ncbi:hypothetical protein [Actinoplanes solisilvae]|uniref:hypothetical protein n=1 Tax=Actinoplanes solisilvae TaxID=2486853 RepID=UPI000FDC1F4F|nr:hypothetical protein [Actinoplanes solisilvae]